MATPGKIIRLANVKTGAPAGAERVDIALGDTAALKIASLINAVSARRAKNLAAGGVDVKCGLTGRAVECVGVNASRIQVVERAGSKGFYMGPAATGGQGAAAALRLPPGSLTDSCTMVMVAYFDALDKAGNYLTNFAVGWNQGAEASERSPARAYGLQYNTIIEEAKGAVGGGAGSSIRAWENLPGSAWSVIYFDYDARTRIMNISVNQAGGGQTFTEPSTTPVMRPGAFLEIGYNKSNNSLRNSAVGECYTFSDSLLSNPRTMAQAQDLVNALKSQYGIQ